MRVIWWMAAAVLLMTSAGYVALWAVDDDVKYTETVNVGGHDITLARTSGGKIEVWAAGVEALASGQGYAHAKDRVVQMLLMRIAGQGRLSELLAASDKTKKVDSFLRGLALVRAANRDWANASPEGKRVLTAYAAGVNAYLNNHTLPFELGVVGYTPAPWEAADSLLIVQLMGYVGLADLQTKVELTIIRAISEGIDLAPLQSLLAPHLDDPDPRVLEVLPKVQFFDSLPKGIFTSVIPAVSGSNNWVVRGEHTLSGLPLFASDPHLDTARLPAIWAETVLHDTDKKGENGRNEYRMGISLPGLPGIVMGRSNGFAWSFTYGFADLVDLFIVEVKDGKTRLDGAEGSATWVPLSARKEVVKVKNGEPFTLTFWESSSPAGILDFPADHEGPPPDGYYILSAYTLTVLPAHQAMDTLLGLWKATSVEEALPAVRKMPLSCNFLLADRTGANGRIAYQQSALAPARGRGHRNSMLPALGWDSSQHWTGAMEAGDLHFIDSPPEGVLVTANNDMQKRGGPQVINLHMGESRASQIKEMLATEIASSGGKLEAKHLLPMQCSLGSGFARKYMELWKPIIEQEPQSVARDTLLRWDGEFRVHSKAATIYDNIYRRMLREVGGQLFSIPAWDWLATNSSLLNLFEPYMNSGILAEDPLLFPNASRDAIFRRAITAEMGLFATEFLMGTGGLPKAWGDTRQVKMKNIFFDGQLPEVLGLDITLPFGGTKDSVSQGTVMRVNGDEMSFMPSWRLVTDLSGDDVATNLPGGPSGSPLSSLYMSGVKEWWQCEHVHWRPADSPPQYNRHTVADEL